LDQQRQKLRPDPDRATHGATSQSRAVEQEQPVQKQMGSKAAVNLHKRKRDTGRAGKSSARQVDETSDEEHSEEEEEEDQSQPFTGGITNGKGGEPKGKTPRSSARSSQKRPKIPSRDLSPLQEEEDEGSENGLGDNIDFSGVGGPPPFSRKRSARTTKGKPRDPYPQEVAKESAVKDQSTSKSKSSKAATKAGTAESGKHAAIDPSGPKNKRTQRS
jgi:hypothetical protein